MIVNKQNFDMFVSTGVVLLDFWAPWCRPCNMLTPIVEKLDREFNGKAKVGKINVDEEPSLAAKHNVSAIPCLILYKNGSPVKTLTGLQSESVIRNEMNLLLEANNA